MAQGIGVRIEGLSETMRKLRDPALLGGPLRRFLTVSALAIERRARQRAPADTTILQGSIIHRIDPAPLPTFAEVGTNVRHARPQEYGTGTLSEAPDSSRRPHFPPPRALASWVRRRLGPDVSPFAVAKAIGRRGGLRPRRFLRGALAESMTDIARFEQQALDEIGRAWGAP